jgi:hypothetical protein
MFSNKTLKELQNFKNGIGLFLLASCNNFFRKEWKLVEMTIKFFPPSVVNCGLCGLGMLNVEMGTTLCLQVDLFDHQNKFNYFILVSKFIIFSKYMSKRLLI